MSLASRTAAVAAPDELARPAPQRSAMLERFGLLARLLIRLTFAQVRVRPELVERVRQLSTQGTVIYVMRYRSTIDYLLVNAVLLREGLPLARFAPGVSTLWWRPLREIVRWLSRRSAQSHAASTVRAPEVCGQLVAAGEPILLFMRSHAVAARRRRALAAARIGPQFLREVVRAAGAASRPAFLVPIAIFRGTGFHKRESRFATLLYSVQEAPGEAKRLFTYLWNAGQTQLTLGREISLHRFVDEHRREGEDRSARRLARVLQIVLYREERMVLGPTLLPRRVVREMVLRDPELVRLTRRLAAERGVPRRKVVKVARGYVDEMAAHFNGLYFGILEFVFNRIFPRVFSGLETVGLERVVECMREHPIVLVPCHRSHFDYLILTYIFHTNYLSPPHIAAGINLSFWPMGPLFRGAGAYFIRRTFDDNELYKMVFRKYLTFLIREGYTQEFFIEGGRTRTGKMLQPKLGMLSAIVSAFEQGIRRDLYLVPVSIHYGRIPEEEVYKREVAGEEKQRESLGALLSARSILSKRFGTAYVSYGSPISLHDALAAQRERPGTADGQPPTEEEKRRFIQRLGFRILREVNATAVAGASSVSATALLGASRAACRLRDFQAASHALVALLRVQGAHLTASLVRNEASDFREGLAWLEGGGLVERLVDSEGVVLHVPTEKRMNLDFYKNNTIHFFLVPALLTRALLTDVPVAGLPEQIAWWRDLYRWEFPFPERNALANELDRWLAYYREVGGVVGDVVDRDHIVIRVTAGILENFREAYLVAARTLAAQREWPVKRPDLIQRMRREFATSLLLGEAHKPEGSSTVTFGNALSRLLELRHVAMRRRGTRDRWVEPGPTFDRLPELIQRLRSGGPR
ncbi:MAG TPA: 1-acyl-sn-glycerol-3-phosphate acyltransferase [Candidatus Binatia bacterium]|nr:1-acyl-sn-glycerol-3-phosphate acyltransferase [Candidatus Binatia bacterium]